MSRKNILFLFCIFLLISISLQAEKIDELNAKGLYHLNKGNYEKSLEAFQKVLQLDPNNSFAHYNLACSLSILLEKNYCENIDKIPEIYKHIQKAVKLKPSYKKKMLKDPDFTPLQKELKFYQIAGLNLANTQNLSLVLTKVHWFGPANGIYGPKDGIIFYSDGSFRYWKNELNEEGDIKKIYYKGNYNIKKSNIYLEFIEILPNFKKKKFKGSLQKGKLRILGFPNAFSDDGSLCSA